MIVKAKGPDDQFTFDASDVGNLRLATRRPRDKIFDAFAQRFFTTRKHILSRRSLQCSWIFPTIPISAPTFTKWLSDPNVSIPICVLWCLPWAIKTSNAGIRFTIPRRGRLFRSNRTSKRAGKTFPCCSWLCMDLKNCNKSASIRGRTVRPVQRTWALARSMGCEVCPSPTW